MGVTRCARCVTVPTLSCCVARPKQQPVGVNCLEILWFQRGSISRQDEAGGSWPPGDGRRRCRSVQLQVVDNTNQPNKPYDQQITNQKKTKSKQAVMQRNNLLRLVKKARSQHSLKLTTAKQTKYQNKTNKIWNGRGLGGCSLVQL